MRKFFNSICFLAILTLLVAACQKHSSTVTTTPAPIHQTRTNNLVFEEPTGPSPILIRAVNGDWYLVDDSKVYHKTPTQKWKFVGVVNNLAQSLQEIINDYKAVNPDDLSLPEAPINAVAAFAFDTCLEGAVTLISNDWYTVELSATGEYNYRKITKPLPCPRACDKTAFSAIF